jgi:hypothetical protein
MNEDIHNSGKFENFVCRLVLRVATGIHCVMLLNIPVFCLFIEIMNLSTIIDLKCAKTVANHFTGFNNSQST